MTDEEFLDKFEEQVEALPVFQENAVLTCQILDLCAQSLAQDEWTATIHHFRLGCQKLIPFKKYSKDRDFKGNMVELDQNLLYTSAFGAFSDVVYEKMADFGP